MQTNLLKPLPVNIQASVTKTATFTGATIEIPLAECYRFILDVTAISGVDTTLDVVIQDAMDHNAATPATFYPVARFAQISTAAGAQQRMLVLQPALGRGEPAVETAIGSTGGALAQNAPLTKKIRHVATIAGAGPSVTYAVWVVCVPRAGSGN